MWTYEQSTGAIRKDGEIYGGGYAGHGPGLNNPLMQSVSNTGPLPCGKYRMTEWRDDDPHTGLGTIVLEPCDGNEMFGRAGFRIHGDSAAHNKGASHGCIIYGVAKNRRAMWDTGDHDLEVVPGPLPLKLAA